MTYQTQIVSALEATAQRRLEQVATADAPYRRLYTVAATLLDTIGGMVTAGDYDADLMAKYAALVEDQDTAAAVSQAADTTLYRIGFEPGFYSPDDVLDTIIREAAHL